MVIVFVLLLFFMLNSVSAQCDSVKNLIENQDFCHNKSVNYVMGVVKEVIDENLFIVYDSSDKNYELVIGNKDNMGFFLEPDDIVSIDGVYLKMDGEERNMIVTTNDRFYILLEATDIQSIANLYQRTESDRIVLKKTVLIMLIISPLLILLAFYFGYNRYIIKKWKGKSFEGYVQKLFPQETWKLIEDNSFRRLKFKRWTESYNNPDFVFKNISKNKEFAIECKYISSINKGIIWAYEDQIKNYNNFSNKKNIPVFIIIGAGGRPNNPRELFLVPLKSLNYPYVKIDYLKRFKRYSKGKIDLNSEGYLK